MLVAKVTCVWLSPSVSVHVLEEPAGFKYDVCAGMLTLSSTIQTCVAVKKQKKRKVDYQWFGLSCRAASECWRLICFHLSSHLLLRWVILMSRQPEEKSQQFDLTSPCQWRKSSKLWKRQFVGLPHTTCAAVVHVCAKAKETILHFSCTAYEYFFHTPFTWHDNCVPFPFLQWQKVTK